MRTCPNCGSKNNSEAKFCKSCGTSFERAQVLTDHNCPVDNRKDSTILRVGDFHEDPSPLMDDYNNPGFAQLEREKEIAQEDRQTELDERFNYFGNSDRYSSDYRFNINRETPGPARYTADASAGNTANRAHQTSVTVGKPKGNSGKKVNKILTVITALVVILVVVVNIFEDTSNDFDIALEEASASSEVYIREDGEACLNYFVDSYNEADPVGMISSFDVFSDFDNDEISDAVNDEIESRGVSQEEFSDLLLRDFLRSSQKQEFSLPPKSEELFNVVVDSCIQEDNDTMSASIVIYSSEEDYYVDVQFDFMEYDGQCYIVFKG